MKKLLLSVVVLASFTGKAFPQEPMEITKESWLNCEISEKSQGWYCGATCSGKNKILGKQGDKCAYEEVFTNFSCNDNKTPTRTYTKCLFTQDDINKIIANNLKVDKSSCTKTTERLAVEECVDVKMFYTSSWSIFPFYIKNCEPYKKDFTFRSLFFYEEIVGYDSGKCVVRSISQIDNKRKKVECRLNNVQQKAFDYLGKKQSLSLTDAIKKFENNKETCVITFLKAEPLQSKQKIPQKSSTPALW